MSKYKVIFKQLSKELEKATFSMQRNFLSQEKLRDSILDNGNGKCINPLACIEGKRWQRAVFKESTFPRGVSEGNFKAHFAEICTWGKLVFNQPKPRAQSRCALPRQLSSCCSHQKASRLNKPHLGNSTVSV